MRAFPVVAALVVAPLLGCAAVYPEIHTPLRDPAPGRDVEAPKGVYWIAFKEAFVPEKTRDGRPWHELGSKLPDPVATLFVNGKELIKTTPESSTLHPTWPDAPRGNFRIADSDRLRVEIWEASLVKTPICVADLRGDEDDWLANRKIDVDCDSGARVVVAFEPPHGKIGYGFYYELRTEGAGVTRVFEESPAAKAGLRSGDTIVTLGDRRAKDMKPGEIQSYLNAPKAEGIKMTVKHDGGQTADVELHEGPVFPLFSEVGTTP